jgi:hypothetical protein
MRWPQAHDRAPPRLHNESVANPDHVFARLRLIGERFEGIGVPVETLVELAAYRDLLLGVAKELFRKENPDRQRVPRGFDHRLQLRLRTVEDGSAMPVLERILPDEALFPLEDEFTTARDVVEDAIAAVAEGSTLPGTFPRDALVLFNRFGQTLKPSEAIELRRGSATQGPRYTAEIRKVLVLSERRAYQQEIEDIGWVSAVDADHMSCLIRLRNWPQAAVPAPLDEVTFTPVKEVLEPEGEGPPVRVIGVGVFHTVRGLLRFDSVHEVSLIDVPEDLATLYDRFDELGALHEGWLDGDGVPPNTVVLGRARRVLADLLNHDVPRPRVYPTPEGGVQAEWTVGEHEISVTFEPDGSLYAISVNVASGESEEPKLRRDDIDQIVELLRAS